MLRSKVRIPEREIEAAVERALRVQGLFHSDEARLLYRLARRKGPIVEIGCWMGRSTAVIVQAAAVWGAEVVSIDPFKVLSPKTPAASLEQWTANLRAVGLTPPRHMQMTSDEAAPSIGGGLGLVFIDGDHSRDQVARDLATWAPKVAVDGVIALHDMFHPSIPGVAQAVTDWWVNLGCGRKPSWELVGQANYTVAFRRVR